MAMGELTFMAVSWLLIVFPMNYLLGRFLNIFVFVTLATIQRA